MKIFTTFFKIQLAFAVLLLGTTLSVAQPVVKVPPTCEVVYTGTGAGVVAGFGGVVGDGGIVAMPDPFDFTTSAGNFTVGLNGTTLIGWRLYGDLSTQTNSTFNAPIQSSGAVNPLNIESYNKFLRFAENPSLLQPLLDTKWARSKGKVVVSYFASPCNALITFEIFKRYTNTPAGTPPSVVPPIVGPDCVLPNTVYTYSVDQIASDNANDAIGFDKYYWSGYPAGSTNVYTSADNSSITFTTPPVSVPAFTLQCCYGRVNPWDGDGVYTGVPTHTTCVGKSIGAQPTAPSYNTAPPTCLNTGLTSFSVNLNAVSGYTYAWSAPGTNWVLSPGGTPSGQTLNVSGIDNNPGTLMLTITNGLCLPVVFTYQINRTFVSPFTATGPTCVSPGLYNYTLPSNGLLNPTTIGAIPSGWTVAPTNGTGSTFSVTIPGTAVGGTYNLKVLSSICNTAFVTLTIVVKPAAPTINPSSPTCVDRGTTPVTTFSCSTVTGATSYTWNLPSGWTCSANCNTTNPTLIPNGTTAGPVAISATANVGTCSGSASTNYNVNYKAVAPSAINALGCINVGVPTTLTVNVSNVPTPFFGTYSAVTTPTNIIASTSFNSAGVITLTTNASTAAGSYNLVITHTTSCGTASGSFPITVTSNGGSLNPGFTTSAGCDNYTVNVRPVGSTITWIVGGVPITANTANVFVSPNGNSLQLCGPTSPGTICADFVIPGGCITRSCTTPVGTHGTRTTNSGTLDGVTIYPNPNTGEFYIKIKGSATSGSANIYDMAGKEVGTFILKGGENKIQTENLSKGTYMVSLTIDGKSEVRQIIIK